MVEAGYAGVFVNRPVLFVKGTEEDISLNVIVYESLMNRPRMGKEGLVQPRFFSDYEDRLLLVYGCHQSRIEAMVRSNHHCRLPGRNPVGRLFEESLSHAQVHNDETMLGKALNT